MKTLNIIFLAILVATLGGCSLLSVSLENEATPLTDSQINMRYGVHSFARAMKQYVVLTSDSIYNMNVDSSAELRQNTILWKIGFTGGLSQSAFVADPELSFLDLWTFIKQHKEFFETGNGAGLFPENHNMVLIAADSMLNSMEDMGSQFYKKKEYELRKTFVEQQATAEPLHDLSFKRNFILFTWKEFMQISDTAVIRTVGNLPQVLAEFSEKVGYFTETTPEQVQWRIDLMKIGFSSDSTLQAEIDSVKIMAAKLVTLAEGSPEIIDSVIQQLNVMLYRVERDFNSAVMVFDKNWAMTVESLPEERKALVEAFSNEREIILNDINELSLQVADKALGHLKGIIRSVLLFGIIFILLLFGLPFFGGYYLGKFMQRSRYKQSNDPPS